MRMCKSYCFVTNDPKPNSLKHFFFFGHMIFVTRDFVNDIGSSVSESLRRLQVPKAWLENRLT